MFKVGDKVRRSSGIDDLDLPKGFETTVVEVCDEGFFRHYDAAGDIRYRHSDEYELVAPTGPVVTETVTKTRIVPGVYDRVSVWERDDGLFGIDFHVSTTTADELDAAAAVLSALAKGLRDE